MSNDEKVERWQGQGALYGDAVAQDAAHAPTLKGAMQRYISFDMDACWVCGCKTAPMVMNVFPTCVSKRKCARRARRRITGWQNTLEPETLRRFEIYEVPRDEDAPVDWKTYTIDLNINGVVYEYDGFTLQRKRGAEGENDGEGRNRALSDGESPETT